jgi:hypothetical protein
MKSEPGSSSAKTPALIVCAAAGLIVQFVL